MHTQMRVGVFLLAGVCACGAARADWVETVSGESLDLGLMPAWFFGGQELDRDPTLTGFSITYTGDRLGLHSNSASTGGLLAVFGTMGTESFGDVRVTAEVSSTSDNFYGVGIRSDLVSDAYVFMINPANQTAEIVKLGSGVVGPSGIDEIADTDPIVDFASYGGDFFLEFSAYGNLLVGKVFDAPNGSLLAFTYVFDNYMPYLSGYSGVIATFNEDVLLGTDDGIDAYFDNISSEAIPTPTAAAGLAMGSMLMLMRRRVRR